MMTNNAIVLEMEPFDAYEAPEELEVTRGISEVVINWKPRFRLKDVIKGLDRQSQGGIYIIEKCSPSGGCTPIYVGEAGNLRARVGDRLEYLLQMAVDLSPYHIWIGFPNRTDRETLRSIEHTLIREIKNQGKGKSLTNVTSRLMFKVGSQGIHITNKNRPSFIRETIRLREGQHFELG